MNRSIYVFLIVFCFSVVSFIQGQTFAKHTIDANVLDSQCLTVADMNNDGKPDIIASGENGLKWYKNLWLPRLSEEDIGFNKPSANFVIKTIDVEANCFDYLHVSDINNDKYPDVLATALPYRGYRFVSYMNPFWKNDPIDIEHPKVFKTKLFNDDEYPDIVSASLTKGKLSLYLTSQLRSDELDAKKPIPVSYNERVIDDNLFGIADVKIADMDRDNDFDVVVTSIAVSGNEIELAGMIIWYENNNLTWKKHIITSDSRGADKIEIADLDNDSYPDIVASGYEADKIKLIYNMASIPFWKVKEINTDLGSTVNIKLADLDGDSDIDIVANGKYENKVVLYKNNHMQWTEYVVDNDLKGASGLAIFDFDNDKDFDIVASAAFDNEVVIYENIKLRKADDKIAPFTISQNYPNPFNPATIITYSLGKESDIDISVYNMLGQQVATLVNSTRPAGSYKVEWNASGYTSGTYFYRIQVNGHTDIKKMILMK